MATAKKVETPSDNPPEVNPTETPETVNESQAPSTTLEETAFKNVVEDVLGGRFGDHFSARSRLTAFGHDATAVLAAVNTRISGGAPSAYRPSAIGLLQQVQDGEWGPRKGLAQRLSGAGFGQLAVNEVLTHLDKE